MEKATSILNSYPQYEAVIGIEVHIQLSTKSKIFCSCANEVSKQPNTNICEICAGYPGSLPLLNKEVVNFAILAGLATNCSIAASCGFARKHYFYPDLPKGYQITQDDDPICTNGYIPIRLNDASTKKIRLTRIHMEEDAGKNIHVGDKTYVDLNRAGTPLLEIVSAPDISTPQEAKAYLKTLHSIVRYLNISTANMEEGAFRADTNISVKKKNTTKLGTRCELKNVNSFKYIGDAIDFEIERQINLIESGNPVIQQTLLWDAKHKKTVPMRTKEEAADYRYFREPDLSLLEITQEWKKNIKQKLPELPFEKLNRFCNEYGLSTYEAEILVDNIELADYFEQVAQKTSSKNIINWILRDVLAYLNENNLPLIELKVTPQKLAGLLDLLEKNMINSTTAKEIFEIIAQTGKEPLDIVKEKGFEQISSEEQIEPIIKKFIEDHSKEVQRYKTGEQKLFGFFVGQIMKKTAGKGNPQLINKLLQKHLS